MSILKDKAEALRLLAAKLEQFGNDVPRKAKEVIRQFGGEVLKCTQLVEAELANDPGFVQHTIKTAGVVLGVDIGRKLAARFKGFEKPIDPYNPFIRGTLKYEAQVYVFTPAELESLVTAALEAGRLQSKFLSTEDIFGPVGTVGQVQGTPHATPPVPPLAFGQRIFCDGDRTSPREIVYVSRPRSPVVLVGPTGREENAFDSLEALQRRINEGMYTRTPR